MHSYNNEIDQNIYGEQNVNEVHNRPHSVGLHTSHSNSSGVQLNSILIIKQNTILKSLIQELARRQQILNI